MNRASCRPSRNLKCERHTRTFFMFLGFFVFVFYEIIFTSNGIIFFLQIWLYDVLIEINNNNFWGKIRSTGIESCFQKLKLHFSIWNFWQFELQAFLTDDWLTVSVNLYCNIFFVFKEMHRIIIYLGFFVFRICIGFV